MSGYSRSRPHLDAIAELGRAHPNLVIVSQDVGTAGAFTQEFPERHFDVGISEQNLVGVAAGLAHVGKLAFVLAMAPFVSMRAYEQIRDDCAYNRNQVKIVALFTGLEAGPWGVTHHAQEDIALMRTIPGMTILVPADENEIKLAMNAAAITNGPVYVRVAGFAADMSPLDVNAPDFVVGRAETLRPGTDITLISTGTTVRTALTAHSALAADGISARVLNMRTIKPLDTDAIADAVRQTGRIMTIEEHSIVGGLGSAVAETIAEMGAGQLVRAGVPDRFCTEIAPYAELLRDCGLDAASVEATARRMLE